MIFGVAGEISAGKTTVAHHLMENYDFQCLSYSAMLRALFRAKHDLRVEPNRLELQEFGLEVTNIVGHSGLTDILLRSARKDRLVIDGIRHYDSYKFLMNYRPQQSLLLYRDIPTNLRFQMHNQRNPSDTISERSFEAMNNHLSEAEVGTLRPKADFLIPFYQDINQLFRTLDMIMNGALLLT